MGAWDFWVFVVSMFSPLLVLFIQALLGQGLVALIKRSALDSSWALGLGVCLGGGGGFGSRTG